MSEYEIKIKSLEIARDLYANYPNVASPETFISLAKTIETYIKS